MATVVGGCYIGDGEVFEGWYHRCEGAHYLTGTVVTANNAHTTFPQMGDDVVLGRIVSFGSLVYLGRNGA